MLIVLYLIKVENKIWISLAFDENTIKENKEMVLKEIEKMKLKCDKKYKTYQIKRIIITLKNKDTFENLFNP